MVRNYSPGHWLLYVPPVRTLTNFDMFPTECPSVPNDSANKNNLFTQAVKSYSF